MRVILASIIALHFTACGLQAPRSERFCVKNMDYVPCPQGVKVGTRLK